MSNICCKPQKEPDYSYRYKLALKTPKIAAALDDYQASAYPQISFLKGDHFQVLDDSEFNFWRVIHLATREVGIVPASLMEPLDQDLDEELEKNI